jgi:hypothetical protein
MISGREMRSSFNFTISKLPRRLYLDGGALSDGRSS